MKVKSDVTVITLRSDEREELKSALDHVLEADAVGKLSLSDSEASFIRKLQEHL